MNIRVSGGLAVDEKIFLCAVLDVVSSVQMVCNWRANQVGNGREWHRMAKCDNLHNLLYCKDKSPYVADSKEAKNAAHWI
jgi:hypothetical protein